MNTKNNNMFEIVKFKWIKKDTFSIIISVIVSLFIILFLPKKLSFGFKLIIYISIVLILYMIIRYCISNNKEKFNNIEYFNDIYNPNEEQYNLNEEQYNLNEEQYNPNEEQYNLNEEQYNLNEEQYNLNEEQYHPNEEQHHPSKEQHHPSKEHVKQEDKNIKEEDINDKRDRPNIMKHIMTSGLEKVSPVNITINATGGDFLKAHDDIDILKNNSIHDDHRIKYKKRGRPNIEEYMFDIPERNNNYNNNYNNNIKKGIKCGKSEEYNINNSDKNIYTGDGFSFLKQKYYDLDLNNNYPRECPSNKCESCPVSLDNTYYLNGNDINS